MPQTAQTYKNHARWFPPFHFFVLPVLLANIVNALRHLWITASLSTGFAALVAAALMMLALSARAMAVTVQNRVIRLEMRLRLGEVLPPQLRSRIHELSPDQLVALRFASDGELPDLTRQVLTAPLTKKRDIKQQVKSWQADHLRA